MVFTMKDGGISIGYRGNGFNPFEKYARQNGLSSQVGSKIENV